MNDAAIPPNIDADLVGRLIAAQFPQWTGLPIMPVVPGGWDNRTFHLGNSMIARLPSTASYALQVEKEQTWLPRLVQHLPLPIPVPLGHGKPAEGFPWPWSIYRWLPGEPASIDRIGDLTEFASDVASFLVALRAIDATHGPPPGKHNFWRGGSLDVYDAETREALAALKGQIDTVAAMQIWETALASAWQQPPVWFHGDIAWGNLLVEHGRLSSVIDFGTCGVGDPACDLALAWTMFHGTSRKAFRDGLQLDDATWARGRGWTLWKALITIAGHDANQREAEKSRKVLVEVLADHRA